MVQPAKGSMILLRRVVLTPCGGRTNSRRRRNERRQYAV
jgi:hypothetical protein